MNAVWPGSPYLSPFQLFWYFLLEDVHSLYNAESVPTDGLSDAAVNGGLLEDVSARIRRRASISDEERLVDWGGRSF